MQRFFTKKTCTVVWILLCLGSVACKKEDESSSSDSIDSSDPETTSGSKRNSGGTCGTEAPVFTGEGTQQDTTPTWSWETDDSNTATGAFRYQFNQSGTWVETHSLSYTHASELTHGTYLLEVQESCVVGNSWSDSGTFNVLVVTHSIIDEDSFYAVTRTSTAGDYTIYESLPPVNSTIVRNGTIALTFSDIIDYATISDSTFVVTVNGSQVYGTITGELTQTSTVRSIISFTPLAPFPLGATVTISISSGMRDDDNGQISGTSTFTYVVDDEEQPVAETNTVTFDPEQFPDGVPWAFTGNGAIVGTISDVSPSEGSYMAILTTGSSTTVSSTAALTGSAGGPQVSTMTLTIKKPAAATYLVFDYDFGSREFDEFVASAYDDIATLTITGSSGGSVSQTLASVKLVGASDSDAMTATGIISGAGVERTTWQYGAGTSSANLCANCVVPNIALAGISGETITLTFRIADVGDYSYDSYFAIDNLRFE